MLGIAASNSIVAIQLKKAINQKGLKQASVATKAGYSAQELNDMLKAYRKVWCQGTGKRRKEESHSGRDSQTESVEKTERCQETDQVELFTR